MRHTVLALLAFAAVPAAAATVPPGPRECVTLSRVTAQRIVDDHTIYFQEGSRWFRNDINPACPGLKPRNAIRSRVTTNRLCSGDIVAVFDPAGGFEYGSCGLGRFTPVDAPPPRPRR